MPHLVAENEQDLGRGEFLDGGVPHHDALGSAEAGDIGVQRIIFSLAIISNMRSGGIARPLRATTFSRSPTSAGCLTASGWN